MASCIVLLAVTLVVGACADGGAAPGDSMPASPATSTTPTAATSTTAVATPSARYEVALARWEAAALGTYRFTFEDDCGECGHLPAREVVVWGDDVYDPERQALTPDEVFTAIEQALAEGQSVEVEYHPDLGYPTDVWIDREGREVDGGTHWILGDLEEGLPGDTATIDDLKHATALWEDVGPDSYELRLSLLCDCEWEGQVWTEVAQGLVTDWDVRFVWEADQSFYPITVDQLLRELEDMLEEDGGTAGGDVVRGSALYDPELGYPRWIGLDFGVGDPDSRAEANGSRLVFVVDQFAPVDALHPVDEWEEAYRRWHVAGLTDYRYDYSIHDVEAADVTAVVRVTVRGGEVVEVEVLEGDVAETPVSGATIDEVLDSVGSAMIMMGIPLDIIYDAELGFPSVVAGTNENGEPVVTSIDNFVEG